MAKVLMDITGLSCFPCHV